MVNYDVNDIDDKGELMEISCSLCERCLGVRFKNEFIICQQSYKIREYSINLTFFSLHEECIQK